MVISNQINFKERNLVFAVRVSILGMVISRRLSKIMGITELQHNL